jgi:hypothetical protein
MIYMHTLELKISPLALAALFALVMWFMAQVIPSFALPGVWGVVLAGGFAGVTRGVGVSPG